MGPKDFDVPPALLLPSPATSQWEPNTRWSEDNLGLGMEWLLLPQAEIHGVPPLAMLVIFPLPKDWTDGGAPHFQLLNPDKKPRIKQVF